MPWMRHLRARPNPRAGRERQACRVGDLLEREAVEFRRDLALEPRLVTLARMLARPVGSGWVWEGDLDVRTNVLGDSK
jgi:hypothetical protein